MLELVIWLFFVWVIVLFFGDHLAEAVMDWNGLLFLPKLCSVQNPQTVSLYHITTSPNWIIKIIYNRFKTWNPINFSIVKCLCCPEQYLQNWTALFVTTVLIKKICSLRLCSSDTAAEQDHTYSPVLTWGDWYAFPTLEKPRWMKRSVYVFYSSILLL